jgi:HSP20 family protein
MNLYEEQEAVYLEALAPGVDPATLDLRVVGNTLRMTGEKRRVAGDVHNVHADYTDGRLLVTLPKTAKATPKQIAVQVG